MKPWVKWLLAIIILAIIVLLVAILRGDEDTWIKDKSGQWVKHGNPSIQDFDSCAKKYPVMETSPEQCAIPNGPTFTKSE
jgi:hypothetical protein